MAQTTKHRIMGVQAGATLIGGITNTATEMNTEVRAEATSGESDPRFVSLVGQQPGGNFATYHIARALALLGSVGTAISALGTGLNFYLGRVSQVGAGPDAGSVHRKYTFSQGILVPVSVTVEGRGDATLTCDCRSVSPDGTTHPIALTKNVALPAGLVDDERFALSKIKLAGQVYTGARSVTINFGLNIEQDQVDGELFDTQASVDTREASIVIRGKNPAWLGPDAAEVPLQGRGLAHADTEIFLRKRVLKSDFHPLGNSEHIKFSASGIAHVPTPFEGASTGAAETEITIVPNYDGTNPPVKVTTGTAIT